MNIPYIWINILLLSLIIGGNLAEDDVEGEKTLVPNEKRIAFDSHVWDPELQVDPSRVEMVKDMLFPHRMTEEEIAASHEIREMHKAARDARRARKRLEAEGRVLQGYHDPPAPGQEPECTECQGLKYCNVLNNKRIEEEYYPESLVGSGGNSGQNTCLILDKLGERIKEHPNYKIFGNGRTFRDTPVCKDIVMQYLCLFWGSDNRMYKNLCVYTEQTDDPDSENFVRAPRPPCRSFCTQVAEICANDHHFVQLCHDIVCPPIGDDCEPDPTIFVPGSGDLNLDANVECELPNEADPYGIGDNMGSFLRPNMIALFTSTVMLMWVVAL